MKVVYLSAKLSTLFHLVSIFRKQNYAQRNTYWASYSQLVVSLPYRRKNAHHPNCCWSC